MGKGLPPAFDQRVALAATPHEARDRGRVAASLEEGGGFHHVSTMTRTAFDF